MQPAPLDDMADQIEKLGEQIRELHDLIDEAIKALKTLPEESLGQDPEGGWFYRDELIYRLSKKTT